MGPESEAVDSSVVEASAGAASAASRGADVNPVASIPTVAAPIDVVLSNLRRVTFAILDSFHWDSLDPGDNGQSLPCFRCFFAQRSIIFARKLDVVRRSLSSESS